MKPFIEITKEATSTPEVVAKTTALLKGLREHLVFLDVIVGHRPAEWYVSIAEVDDQ